jgi:hypothetical protein
MGGVQANEPRAIERTSARLRFERKNVRTHERTIARRTSEQGTRTKEETNDTHDKMNERADEQTNTCDTNDVNEWTKVRRAHERMNILVLPSATQYYDINILIVIRHSLSCDVQRPTICMEVSDMQSRQAVHESRDSSSHDTSFINLNVRLWPYARPQINNPPQNNL